MPYAKHCCCEITAINCDDGTFDDCFNGYCIRVEIDGVVAAYGDCPHYDCDCPGNGIFYGGPIGTYKLINSCNAETSGGGNLTRCLDFLGRDTATGASFRFVIVLTSVDGEAVAPSGISVSAGSGCADIFVPTGGGGDFGLIWDVDGLDVVAEAINTLCAGGSVALPLTGTGDGPRPDCCYCDYSAATCVVTLIKSGCPGYTIVSYNCVSGVCTKLSDTSGTYNSLDDCIVGGCGTAPASYSCVSGTCTDPHDGSGDYSSLEDCVAAGCAAPTCDSLDSCTPTLVAEVHGMQDCVNGGDTFSLARLNGGYQLDFDSISAPISIYKLPLNPTPDDHGSYDAATQLYETSVIGGTTIETYVHAVEAHISCSDGEVTTTEWQWHLESFSTSDGGVTWFFAGTSTVPLNAIHASLSATVTGCTSGQMLTIFDITDCNSVAYTATVSGALS